MKKLLIATVALGMVASAGIASAQPGNRQNERHDQRTEQRNDHAERRDDRQDNRYERRAERRYKADRYKAPRGYQARQWRHGDRLPANYRDRTYYVDYHRYALSAPPRGYQYVRVGNDVVLVSTTNGLIASVIQQLFQ